MPVSGQFSLYFISDIIIGHEVVQLPVAHCTLNPIEMAWAQVKGHIKANTRQFTLTEVEQLAWEGFDQVTPDKWKALVERVQTEVEDHYWRHDGLYEELVEEFIVQVGGESSDESESNSDSDDADSDSSDDE